MEEKVATDIVDSKFIGIIELDDLGNTNHDAVKKFIEHNLIIRVDIEERFSNNKFENKFPLDFDNGHYLFRKDLLNEIYYILKFYVEEIKSDYWSGIDDHFRELNSILNPGQKVEYLENYYKQIYPIDNLYPIYTGEGANGIKNWKDWVISDITSSFELMKIYVSTKINATNNNEMNRIEAATKFVPAIYRNRSFVENNPDVDIFQLLEEWEDYFVKHNQLKIILNKIHELNGSRHTIIRTYSNDPEKLSALEVAYYAYYMCEAKESFVSVDFPSQLAWAELSKTFRVNAKNIQLSYNQISRYRDIRLGKGRGKKIQKVMKHLHPKALTFAESDLISI
jgi:hypothetical protein